MQLDPPPPCGGVCDKETFLACSYLAPFGVGSPPIGQGGGVHTPYEKKETCNPPCPTLHTLPKCLAYRVGYVDFHLRLTCFFFFFFQ